MRKILTKLLLFLIVIICAFSFVGCTIFIQANNSGEQINPNDEGANESTSGSIGNGSKKMSVSVYAAGNGTLWLQKALEYYINLYPEDDVSITFKANSSMFDTVKDQLTADTCKDDLVLIADSYYKQLVTAGKLLDISDLVLNQSIPFEDGTLVKDVIDKSHLNYRGIEGEGGVVVDGVDYGKQYGVPWQDNVPPGFVYNKKMFAENGWNTEPKTMKEFFNLCNTITATGINAFAYGGGAQMGYLPTVLNKWFADYYGYDYVANTFQKYDNVSLIEGTAEGRLKCYSTLAQMLYGSNSNGTAWAYPNCKGLSPSNAQMKFIDGEVAMVVCGNWFPQEMSKRLKADKYKDFEFGFIPMPHINDNLKDKDGNDSSSVRYSLNSNCLAIPTSAKYKTEAAHILISMFTRDSYKTFVDANNGLTRPISVDIDSDGLKSDFAKTLFDFTNMGKQSGQFIYENSKAIMSRNGKLSMFLATANGASNIIGRIIQAGNYSKANNMLTQHVTEETAYAKTLWDYGTGNWKEIYLVDED